MPNQGATSFFTKMIHASFVSLATLLLTLLQLRSGNKNVSPFETHGPIMMLFTITILIYALVAMATITVQTLANHPSFVSVLNQLSISLGFLACDLLLLVLAPPVGYFFLVIWIFLLLMVLFYYVFTPIFDELCNCADQLYNKVKNCFKKWSDCLRHATPEASTTSSTAQTSMEQEERFGESENNERNTPYIGMGCGLCEGCHLHLVVFPTL